MAIIAGLRAIIQLLIQALGLGVVGYTLYQHGPELSEAAATSAQQITRAAGNVAEGAGNLAKDAGNMGGGILLLGGAVLLVAVLGR
ncbi:MAG: hypothetical protein ACM3US_07280 [Sphingomonadaceae bacterium]